MDDINDNSNDALFVSQRFDELPSLPSGDEIDELEVLQPIEELPDFHEKLIDLDAQPTFITDLKLIDGKNRPITIRSWQNGEYVMIRAYDTNISNVPEEANLGQAGYANITLEADSDGIKRAKLNDLFVPPNYRKAGISQGLLEQVKSVAHKQKAIEIYGIIDDEKARSYWKSQAELGWSITRNLQAYYGEVRYRL